MIDLLTGLELKAETTIAKQPTTRWGAERRLEFIEFRLQWDGTVNRSELVSFFGISTQQASADLARYLELAPDNLEYDKNQKTYRVSARFKPAMTRPDAHAYLNQLSGLATGTIAASASFLGWTPPHDLVRYPARPIPTDTLIRILWAIRDREEVELQYQSMRRPAPTVRWISPHAIAFDGFRWHARAWCSENNDFRDFVFSRIQKVVATRPSTIDPGTDIWWNTTVDVVVKPRDELTPEQRQAIEIDFGMTAGHLKLTCRKALAFYLLRQLQIERDVTEPPAAQPLELVNREGLKDVLTAARKVPSSNITVPVHQKGVMS